MKKVFLGILLVLLVSTAGAQTQNVDTLARGAVYIDTLTAVKDTFAVSMKGDALGLDAYSVIAYTTAGIDTVTFSFLAPDGVTWYKETLTDMAAQTDSTTFRIGTTPRAFLLQQSFIKMRLTTEDLAASCVFMILGKRTFSSHF